MFLLPKGIALAENVPTSKIELPAALNKLRNSSFCGYAEVDLLSAVGIFLFIDGRLISVLFKRGDTNGLRDLDAIKTTIECLVLNREGAFSVYRISKDISFAMLAMLKGDVVLNAQEMKLIDFRGVLEKIKAERMNACLKVYTDDRAGLIFYRDGLPIGFFHDTAQEIGVSQVEVQKIVGLPGAKIDLLAINESEETSAMVDLNDLIDIAHVWSVAKENVFSPVADSTAISATIKTTKESPPEAQPTKNLVGLHAGLIEIVVTHLGKLGQTLSERELAKTGEPKNLLVPENLDELLVSLEKGAKLLTSSVKIRQMQDSIRVEVARYS